MFFVLKFELILIIGSNNVLTEGKLDGLSGLVVRVSGYISRDRVRFPALPDVLTSSGPGTGSTQPLSTIAELSE
jgi:hypothetical protein